ncbi:2-desacetyl-2-hydroxyethyl bacteriochlorophyllide A dehydrogenase [Candidatus Electronema halotolerans]
MKAAVVYGINDIRVEERPEPSAGPGEIVVRTKAAGICAQDFQIVLEQKLPAVPGQDLAGEISAVGAGVRGFAPGEPVAVHPAGLLGQTVDGVYAEYVRIPEAIVSSGGVVRLNEEMSFEDAVLAEPLAWTFAAARADRMRGSQQVLIIGCGSVGLLHLKTAKWAGCKVMAMDSNPTRLALAGQMGADHLISPAKLSEEVLRCTNGKGAETVIISVPLPELIDDCIKLTAKGGVCNTCSREEPTEQAKQAAAAQGATLTGLCPSSVGDFKKCLQLIQEEAIIVSDMISHRFTLDTLPEAAEKINNQELLRGVITFSEIVALAF